MNIINDWKHNKITKTIKNKIQIQNIKAKIKPD